MTEQIVGKNIKGFAFFLVLCIEVLIISDTSNNNASMRTIKLYGTPRYIDHGVIVNALDHQTPGTTWPLSNMKANFLAQILSTGWLNQLSYQLCKTLARMGLNSPECAGICVYVSRSSLYHSLEQRF